ncbi:hypothetical protein [Rhodococcus jostii]|uniref:hypothetical protein n=1 Tax=Rhodococcus jostii TaxID=132919 RepID=UPI003649C60F
MGSLGGILSRSLHAEHLSIDCEHPTHADQELAIEAKIDRIVGDRVHTRAVLRAAGCDQLIANATGIYMTTSSE